MSARLRSAALGVAVALISCLCPPGAEAAKLLGGRAQTAVVRAFAAERGHAGARVISVRASTHTAGWAVARWVLPNQSAKPSRRLVPALHSSFFRLTGGTARPGSPPGPARRELQAPFRVRLVFAGAGSEAITYTQSLRSGCNPAANYVDEEQVTVKPMSWNVAYVVSLDQLQAAVQGAGATVVLPAVSFDRGASELLASEALARTTVDQGCFGSPATIHCTHSFFLSSAGAAGEVSLLAGDGTEIGLPFAIGDHGNCAAENYPLGPSLWDSGAATALVRSLNLTGHLPANPYAPIPVRWPHGSATAQTGFLTSPCQGLSGSCRDRFRFSGKVQIVPITG